MKRLFIVTIAVLTGSLPSLAFGESMLKSAELEGLAVETPSGLPLTGQGRLNTAMLAASETQAQVRRVELFLKSGPARSGDLRVVQTSKPDLTQK